MAIPCCCCREIAVFQQPNFPCLYNIDAKDDAERLGFTGNAVFTGNDIEIDRRNRKLYTTFTRFGQHHINRWAKNYKTLEQSLLAHTLFAILKLAVDWGGERIFYVAQDIPVDPLTWYLRRCNYDGTGDTSLHTNTFAGAGLDDNDAFQMHYDPVTDAVFLVRRATTGNPGPFNTVYSVRSIPGGGGGDTELYAAATNTELILSLALDQDSGSFWIAERTSGGSPVSSLKRFAKDGSGETTIYTESGQIYTAVAYSHKFQRVFFYRQSSAAPAPLLDVDGGIWSVAPDGTDPQQHLTRKAFHEAGPTSPTAPFYTFRLGCGLERMDGAAVL